MTQTSTLRAPQGRLLKATPVLDTYWRFAALRQAVFHRRVLGESPPWTEDPVLAGHRFTNAYRASDRVSQYLIRHVQYSGRAAADELFFRTLLFKIFNRIDTWEGVMEQLGFPTWEDFSLERFASVLDFLAERRSIYSAAYMMPAPRLGAARKHRNHLLLLEQMMNDRLPEKIATARSLSEVYHQLLAYPSLGRFLAFQFAIDLNYSELCRFSEDEFVVAGPGARDGIGKCFVDCAGYSDEDVIAIVAENAEREFERLDLHFMDLWGRKLHLVDCQNLFCEVSKYARIAHPEYAGRMGRTRIKQKFQPELRPLPQWYPPKWRLELPAAVPCGIGASPLPFRKESEYASESHGARH